MAPSFDGREMEERLAEAEGKLEETKVKLEEAESKMEQVEGKLHDTVDKLQDTEDRLSKKEEEQEKMQMQLARQESSLRDVRRQFAKKILQVSTVPFYFENILTFEGPNLSLQHHFKGFFPLCR